MSLPEPDEFVTGGTSDIGRVREVNQDYWGKFNDSQSGRLLLMIADGMGGHAGGEVASKMAVETVAEIFAAGGDDSAVLLREALELANARVHEAAQEDPDLTGMGTTGVCLLFENGGRGCVAHVGDSRAYRLRAERFEQLTEDHSVVGALIRMGRLTQQEAKLHPQRNEILRAIGTAEHVEVQVTRLELQPGDRYLLCSDGLSGLVADAEIADVLRQSDPEAAARSLVERANREGGNDNITVQVAAIPGDRLNDGVLASKAAGAGEQSRPPAWLWGVGIGLAGALAWLLLGGH